MKGFKDVFEEYDQGMLLQVEPEYEEIKKTFKEKGSIRELQQLLNDNIPKKGSKNIRRYLNIILFIQYYFSEFPDISGQVGDISKILKEEIDKKISQDDIEYSSYILKALFALQPGDEEYYISTYDRFKKKERLYSDICSSFVIIFVGGENKKYFIDSFNNLNLYKSYGESFNIGFKYLISFNNGDFKKYFGDFLLFFSEEKNKKKLTKHHRYNGVFDFSYNTEKGDEIESQLIKKLNELNDKDFDKDIIYKYIVGDLNYFLERHYSNDEIRFLLFLSNYIFQKYKGVYIDLLDDIEFRVWSFEFADYYARYIQLEDTKQLYDTLNKKDSLVFILHINDSLKKLRKPGYTKIISAFKKYSGIKKLYKIRDKNIQKNLNRLKKEKEKDRKVILKAISEVKRKRKEEGKRFYSPKVVYEFDNRESRNDKKSPLKISKILTQKQFELAKEEAILSIKTFFDIYNESNLEWYKENFEFKNIGDNRVSYPKIVIDGTFDLFLKVANSLEIDISKFYKVLIGFLPFVSIDGNESVREKTYLNYCKRLGTNEINYILDVYSPSRDSKDDVRYCQNYNLLHFADKFYKKFTKEQKERYIIILKSYLFNYNTYSHFQFKCADQIKVLEKNNEIYFEELFNKHIFKFNYFIDVLKTDRKEKDPDLLKMKLLSKINSILIIYGNEEAIKWRISQVENGVIEQSDTLDVSYPHTTSYASYISDAYSELYGFHENNRFVSVFENVKDIKYKDDFLKLLEQGLKILKEVEEEKISKDFFRYGFYLVEAFLIYTKGLKKEFKTTKLYNSIKKKADKIYKNNVYLSTSKLNTIFGRDYKDQAVEILGKGSKGQKEVEDLLSKINTLEEKNRELEKRNEDIASENIAYNELHNSSNNTVVYVEGITDLRYLNLAYAIFSQEYERPLIYEKGGARQVCEVLNYISGIDSSPSEISVIGMFDFDSEGVRQYMLLKEAVRIENNYYVGRAKKLNNKKIYAFLLPIPENTEIEHQVIYTIEQESGNTRTADYGEHSEMEIEHLFYDYLSDDEKQKYFDSEYPSTGGNKIIKFKGGKNDFCNFIESKAVLDKSILTNIKKVLNIIKSISKL